MFQLLFAISFQFPLYGNQSKILPLVIWQKKRHKRSYEPKAMVNSKHFLQMERERLEPKLKLMSKKQTCWHYGIYNYYIFLAAWIIYFITQVEVKSLGCPCYLICWSLLSFAFAVFHWGKARMKFLLISITWLARWINHQDKIIVSSAGKMG